MKISLNDIGKRGWLQGPEFIKELEEFDKENNEDEEEE
jgi:hypothetical protein|tara:strand:- start:229 stop:342 length:114 start_codon:yes stop_codon:yes gene_type:complete